MKRPPRPEEQSGEALRVGEELRDARMALGLTLEEMSARLRIRRPYLAALEEGRAKDLPGAAYAVGFVRAYSTGLGLDADEMVRRYRDGGASGSGKKTDLVFPEPVPSRGVPAGAVILVGAVLAVGAYAAWYQWSGTGSRAVDAVPPLPPRLEQAAREGGAPPATEPPLPGIAGTRAVTLPGATPAGPPSAPSPAVPTPSAAPAPPPPPDGPRVVLRARGDSWVQVRDTRANNQVVFDRVLRSGETAPVPARDGLVLTTGKAESLDILLDGEVTPALAGQVGVRRGIALDADRLRPAPATPAAVAPAPAATAPAPPPPRPTPAVPRPAAQGAPPAAGAAPPAAAAAQPPR